MSNITIPFWIFALSIGVPSVTLFCLLGILLRRIRSPKKDMFENMCLQPAKEQQPSSQQFHNDLLQKQIDTIFNGLNAIIETERLKITALLNPEHNFLLKPAAAPAALPADNVAQEESRQVIEQETEAVPTLEQQVANLASSDDQLEDMASDLGLSEAEIELAQRMRSSKGSVQGKKLEAVA